MKEILFNTIKICVAAIASILIASALELEFAIAAGIVTILTIQTTKQETIKTALDRFYAFTIGTMIAYLSFTICGYSVYGFFLYLFIYIFICQYFKWYSAMAMNSVLISHFLTFKSMEMVYLYNEIYLFLIGVGIGIFANMHLHKKSNYINDLKEKSDAQIKHILIRMSQRIVEDVDDYDGNCFEVLNALIAKAKTVEMENVKNTLIKKDQSDHAYIKMREQQAQVLYEMYKTIRKLHTTPFTAHVISDFLVKISNEFSAHNDCRSLLEDFNAIDKEMKKHPLPNERSEFEDRARLFTLLRLIEEFLEIKKTYYYQNNKRSVYEYKAEERD